MLRGTDLSALALALETPLFLFRAAILFRKCGLSCTFNFSRKDNLVQNRFCSHTVLLMNISRLELTSLWNTCCTLLWPKFWKGSLFMLLWSWRFCSFCGMTYQVTCDVSMKGGPIPQISPLSVLEGMVELQEAAAWSSSLILMAAPALTGRTVGFWFLTYWRYYDFLGGKKSSWRGVLWPPQVFLCHSNNSIHFSTGMPFLALLKGNLFSRVCNGTICYVFSSA